MTNPLYIARLEDVLVTASALLMATNRGRDTTAERNALAFAIAATQRTDQHTPTRKWTCKEKGAA